MSNFGTNYMKEYPLERGFEQFLQAVDDMINTDYDNREPINPVYNKTPFEATEETVKVAKTMRPTPYVDPKGPKHRFLRRVKNYTKRKAHSNECA